jgi:cation diffusion facilitator family transporter
MRPQAIFWAQILINTVLFGVNYTVATISNSRIVFSEAIYIAADLVAVIMVLWGFRASQRPPDATHPFGRGKERFFWSFTATLVTFTLSGLFVISGGISQLSSPQTVGYLGWAVLVIGLTLGASVIGILITLRELRRNRETVANLLDSPHQGTKMIFYQDVVSVFASIVAFIGILIVFRTHSEFADGLASILIGVLLLMTGFVLAAESRELLVGKAIPFSQGRKVLEIVSADPRVRSTRTFQSMMLGPDDVLLALKVNFRDGLTTDELERAIDDLAVQIRKALPSTRHLVIEPES